ncbi:MAG TPA: glycosyltransferase [Candidatus Paceibacterota bacterium]
MNGVLIDQWIVYALLFASIYFEVFLLTSFIERRMGGLVMRKRVSGVLPAVAIVVPSFNEAQTISGTISSLLALQYPKDKLEIIVVDDGSTDDTLSVAKRFESDSRVRVFYKENGGKHTAMNFALSRTSAELIGCLDADSEVAPEALRAIVSVFEDKKVAAATPGIHVKDPKTLLQKMQNVEYRLSLFNRFAFAAKGSTFITPGPFSLFRTAIVRQLGAWRHAHSTEDMEMALRIQAAGFLIANVPEAIVHTTTPSTLPTLFRQRVRWTYGWLRNAIDYRYMFGNHAYGNLGLIILPAAILSIFAGIYFFARAIFFVVSSTVDTISRVYATGVYPQASLDPFYLTTSTVWFLIFMSVALVFLLLCAGTMIGTGRRLPPRATPLFLVLYSFLAPLWYGTAIVRAAFKTGVRWR